MYKYKTKNGQELVIPGVGKTEDGVIVSPRKLNNRNLEFVEEIQKEDMKADEQKAPEAPQNPMQSTAQAQTAAPGAIIGVAPQATAPAAPVQQPQNNQEQDK